MEFNYITLFSIYISSLMVISHASSPISSSIKTTTSSSPHSSITSLVNDLKTINSNIPEKVIEACKTTDFPSECSSSVAPLLLDGKSEPLDILQGQAKALTHALEIAKENIDSLKSEVKKEQTILTCKQMYENAKGEISKAMELASRNDKYGVNVYFSGAITFIETCKDELPKDLKNDSTIILVNNLLSNLASNCLALGNFAMGLHVHN
ncbi:hypothetical protein RND81_10G249500 [Saponaria officinalis]|uniref:Pectinesterase inhibitor domain-containing protein n=1 Tax=Saponaria officinalis TaxID=3572 RepID=A0AAW1I609_SAPOF